jgi:hypothetical protein
MLARKGEMVEYETAVWDGEGRVVCTGRQVALVRSIPEKMLAETRRKFAWSLNGKGPGKL